jgi:hypothetical protein
MTSDETVYDVTTTDEFRSRLTALLRDAHENGVSVNGGWECRNGDGAPDWEAVVTPLEKEGSE